MFYEIQFNDGLIPINVKLGGVPIQGWVSVRRLIDDRWVSRGNKIVTSQTSHI